MDGGPALRTWLDLLTSHIVAMTLKRFRATGLARVDPDVLRGDIASESCGRSLAGRGFWGYRASRRRAGNRSPPAHLAYRWGPVPEAAPSARGCRLTQVSRLDDDAGARRTAPSVGQSDAAAP